MEKVCPCCKLLRPIDKYHRDRKTKDGHAFVCKGCLSARKRQWRKENPATAHARERADNLRRKNLNEEMLAEMWKAQKGLCAICLKGLRRTRLGHAVDHCHVTRRTRGLLCQNCNFMIGHARDDPARLRAAAAYLESYAARIDQPRKPPPKRAAPRYESDGLALTAKEWAARSGISPTTIHWRLSQGISLSLPPQPTRPRLRDGTGNYTKAMLVRWSKPGAREKQAEHMRAWHAARKARL